MHATVTCFGTGDGAAIPDRNRSAYLYAFGETKVLLDCGEPISRTLKAAGVSVDAIDRLIISHLHSDHFGGFFMLVQGFWLDQRQKPLPIHLPGDAIAPLRQMLQAAYLYQEKLPFQLSFIPLRAQAPIIAGPVRITPYTTTHLDRLRQTFQAEYPGDYLAYCFLLEAEGVRVVHSADIGAPEDLAPLLEKPVDLLVCELAHAKPEAMFTFLKGRNIRQILFTHMGRCEWEHIDEVKALAGRILAGMNYSFASDGLIVRV